MIGIEVENFNVPPPGSGFSNQFAGPWIFHDVFSIVRLFVWIDQVESFPSFLFCRPCVGFCPVTMPAGGDQVSMAVPKGMPERRVEMIHLHGLPSEIENVLERVTASIIGFTQERSQGLPVFGPWILGFSRLDAFKPRL
jgi:hypothetical protein